ncbi:prolipoprotein diacylglyceryl transferase [soil metagenome]
MHPIFFEFPNHFFIAWYGVLIATGLFAGLLLAGVRGPRRGIPRDAFFDLIFLAVASGFLGARILFIITEFKAFLADPMPMILSRTGFVFLGGLLAATGACSWYAWKKKLDYWRTADVIMPSVALGHAFGRIGCFMSGCCYGGSCAAPVAIRVPKIFQPDGNGLWQNAFADQYNAGTIPATATASLPIWPVQLFESGALFAITLMLVLIARKPHHKGLIFGLYLVTYGAVRFGLEFLRGDEARGLWFNNSISTSQIISIVIILAGAVVLATMKNREVYGPEDTSQPRRVRPTTGKPQE